MSNGFFISTSNRIKSTPFSSRNELAGVKNYTVYNNTLLPTIFKSLKDDYYHLTENVQLWDVCCQKVIEVKGRKSLSLIQYLFCRDFSNISSGKAYYAPIVNFEGGLLNDPVVFCIADNHFLISLSDSDLFNWVSAINNSKEYYSEVRETDIFTIAIQGPKAKIILNKCISGIDKLKFMNGGNFKFKNYEVFVTRSGYTGEDGFEVSIENKFAELFVEELLKLEAKLIGLGARDTLRLEAGLCLYGNDIDVDTTPIEANLKWAISKNRIDTNYPGSKIIKDQIQSGVNKIRVGIKPETRVIARGNTKIFNQDNKEIGKITSGTFGPSVDHSIAMGYVENNYANSNTKLFLEVRGKKIAANICNLPFYKKNYVKGEINV